MIGKTISHYKIIEKLGKGGMGVVYKAEDTKLKRTVALKFLPPELTRDPDAKKRFIREAQAASTLEHPNICTIHEINETKPDSKEVAEKQLYIAMACYEGETLKQKLAKGILPTYQSLDFVSQIAQGLEKAHEKGITHRDIKSANIIITTDGIVKILDFGLAKLSGQTLHTKTGTTVGTVAYMSPEQARGEVVDHRSDIWSFGVVLYEMVTGNLPFKGDYDQAVIYAILNEEPALKFGAKDQLNRLLESLVTKTLKKNPHERYQSMGAIRSELEKIKNHLSTSSSRSESTKTEDRPSLAVLPFVNMSADPGNEYFSDGLTEELINALTGLKDFRVVARTSAFAFKGKHVDVRDIGHQLDVQHVLEGSVRKSGDRIRITAQLINIEDGYHLWSEKYDRDLEDVFAIQDEISAEIAAKLQSEFIHAGPAVTRDKRLDMQTYELYLKGRYYFNKFSAEWIFKAQQTFLEAISLDPTFAQAHAGLAETYVFLTNPTGLLDAREALPKAKSAAEQALRLDPNLSEAYTSLGAVASLLDWDSHKAHEYFEKAIQLNSDNVNARLWYELALSLLDQDFDRALEQMNYALEIDPLNMMILGRTGYVYVYKYEYEIAATYFNKIISIEPDSAFGHHGLMDVYGVKGEYDMAIAEGEQIQSLGGGGIPSLAILGCYYARSGNLKKAQDILSALLKRYDTDPISPFWIGVLYMGLEDFDEMYAWYDRAFEQRDSNLLYTFVAPFDPIRDQARFKALRKRMGFKP